jgi:hypothetical protein
MNDWLLVYAKIYKNNSIMQYIVPIFLKYFVKFCTGGSLTLSSGSSCHSSFRYNGHLFDSCVYFLSDDLAAWNLHGIIMSLLCRLLDAGFILSGCSGFDGIQGAGF